MLEYRDFPLKTAVNYILFAPVVSYCIYIITQLMSGQLFLPAISDHMPLLGFGALAATITLPITGFVIDRIERGVFVTFGGAIIPIIFYFIGLILGFPNAYSPIFEYAFVMSIFCSLAIVMVSWTVVLNRSIVVGFRGRTVASFIAFSLFGSYLIAYLQTIGITMQIFGISLIEISVLVCTIIAAAMKPWRLAQVPLAVHGHIARYFFPTAFIMAAYMLWYFSKELVILANLPSYISLSISAGIPEWEPVLLIGGVIAAGIMADQSGRKTTFSISIFIMGFLTIFSSVFYYTDPVLGWQFLPIPLLVLERIVEGFLLGLCLVLIWTELGSPKKKGIRLASIWLFFLGFMCLFWAVDLNAWGWTIPPIISQIGGQIAILLSLISLYWSGHLPEILSREVEMEELDLDFDEDLVRSTVDAFLGKEDFESVQRQVEIIDAGSDLSEDELTDILGEDFGDMLPLRRIPGIGSALEKKLNEAGYKSAAQLAGEKPSRLASRVEGLGEARAEKIVSAAGDTVKKVLKSEKKE